VSTLENQLMMFLQQQVDYVDAKKMASHFQVSSKTIYRTIDKLNQKEILIESQRGRGFKFIDGKQLDIGASEELQRRVAIMTTLLSEFPKSVSVYALTERFYISDSTLLRDLHILEKQIKEYKIRLIHQDKQIGLVATESEVRKALNYFLLEHTRAKQIQEDVSTIFPDISSSDRKFIMAQMILLETELGVKILDPYPLNIFSHLYILIDRIRKNQVDIDRKGVNDIYDKALLHIANKIIDNISEYIDSPIQESEIQNLLVYLLGLRFDQTIIGNIDADAEKIVDRIIKPFDWEKGGTVESLKKSLLGHVQPMLNRLRSNIAVVNPLLQDIQFNYSDVFSKIKNQLHDIDFNISNDEIGFLTLYVVRALEEVHAHKKVLLMCSTGVGTAQLLETKVRKAFPDFEVVGTISAQFYQDNLRNYQDVDLVISTINIQFQPVSPVIQVSALFTENDRRRIEELL
jgi:activator of the mannose operon (transcriptional antiterminator)